MKTKSSFENQGSPAPELGLTKNLTPTYLLVTIVAPALLWLGAIQARGILITPRCLHHIEICDPSRLSPMDQFSLGHEDGVADGYSYLTQNLSGALGFGIPLVWDAILLGTSRLTPAGLSLALTQDLTLMTQSVVWNGLFTEISHDIAGRPRPFVYSDPATRGVDSAHYTSFYSGHTSFAAVTQTMLFLILLNRGAPLGLLFAFLGIGETLVFSTAYFRMMAGRHFFTDVICGALAGAWVAATVAMFSRAGLFRTSTKRATFKRLAMLQNY